MSVPVFESQFPQAPSVVDFSAARERLRLARCRQRIESVLEHNRRAVEALFDTGQLFTRSGSKVGRELLLSRQKLMRLVDQVGHAEKGQVSGPLPAGELDALLADVERLLENSSDLARRNRGLFSSRPGR